MNDTRIVAGARCSWWDSIQAASTTEPRRLRLSDGMSDGLPCCPHCSSPLMQWDNEEAFKAGIPARAEQLGRDVDDFARQVDWLRGVCLQHPNGGIESIFREHEALQRIAILSCNDFDETSCIDSDHDPIIWCGPCIALDASLAQPRAKS